MLHIRCGALVLVLGLPGALGCDETTPKSSAPTTKERAPEPPLANPTGRPMLLVFSRDYCTPCQVMKPWVSELAAAAPGVDVVTVNVDRQAHEHIGGFFKISAVPTLVYLQGNGDVARRTEGLAKKGQMLTVLRELGWAP